MTLKFREAQSNAGPDSTGMWMPFAGPNRVDLNDYTNSARWPVYVAPQVSAYSVQRNSPTDFLSSAGYIQTLSRIWIMFDANLSASLSTTISFDLMRANTQLGSATIAGWASGASPAFTAFTPVAVPFNTSNTTALAPPPSTTLATTRGLARLKPLDVITFLASTKSQFSTANMYILLDVQ